MIVYKAIEGSKRVLASSNGQVWSDGVWRAPVGEIKKMGQPYYKWNEVPFVHVNACPYWR